MTRYLLVVPPLVGHISPLVGVAAELRRRGHAVAWAGSSPRITALVPDAHCYPTDGPLSRNGAANRPATRGGFEALRFLWERFLLPLADEMVDTVDAAVDSFDPDVLIVDQQALAGALVAVRRGMRWATSASTSSELTAPLTAMPRVDQWICELQQKLASRHGLCTAEQVDLRFSPALVLAYTTPALSGATSIRSVRFVGPALDDRVGEHHPYWDTFRPARRLVVVTLGTSNVEAAGPFLARCRQALRDLKDIQAILVDPTASPEPRAYADAPHVVTAATVPLIRLLRHASALLCHGGHNTVCEGLSFGVPLVVAPIRDDQPVVAAQVVAAGAGVRLRFGRSTPADIADALHSVLTDPSHAAQAARIRKSFESAGGARAAADHLEALAER